MSLFEALYGWSCNTAISWSDPINIVLIGLDSLVGLEWEMQVIKKNLKAPKDRQKRYVYQNRLFKEFQVEEQVYYRIKPKNNSLQIGACTKLAQQFYGPFGVIERIGLVAYQIALPPIGKVHDVFHVSLLKKYIKYVDFVIGLSILQVELDGEFQLDPQSILQRKILMLWNEAIEQVKVQWKHIGPNEATWEMVEQIWAMYPSLFTN